MTSTARLQTVHSVSISSERAWRAGTDAGHVRVRRAAGRGPRWATTSTARLWMTVLGTRCRCPRTTRVAIGALRLASTPVTCACTRSGGTWTKVGDDIDGEAALDFWVVGIDVFGRHARSDPGAPRNDGHSPTPTCGCSAHLAMHLQLPQMGLLATAWSWRASSTCQPRATRGT